MLDTIVALASAPGHSPSGLIRLSGPDAARIGRLLLGAADRDAKPPETPTVRGAFAARLRPPLPPVRVLVLWLPGPRSFTGEDTLELEVPGHPALLARVVREAERHGARRAEPGEFSHRAFEAGRISLLEAEGTAAAIAADGEAELAAAEAVRGGKLAEAVTTQRDTLVSLLALVEAGIDFTDQEDVVPITPADLRAGLAEVGAALAALAIGPAASPAGLPRVVLAGPPSAGKSSLFNALLGRERAVTDPTFHTTRDALEEELKLPGGAKVVLVDAPGHETAAPANADLVLWFGDGAAAPADALLVRSKADLAVPRGLPLAGPPATPAPAEPQQGASPLAPICVSAVTGEGIDELLHAVAAALANRPAAARAATPALLTRHRAALAEAAAAVGAASALTTDDATHLGHPELVADALTRGVHALGSLTGEVTPDDLIASIFTSFCVGK